MYPIFVKGHVSFQLEGKNHEYLHQGISAWGVTGLPWESMNARDHFGKTVVAQVKILTSHAFGFRTQAQVIREYTAFAENMGLRFYLDAEARKKLQDIITDVGYLPTEYMRKYPRIPSSSTIQTFPLRAQVMPLQSGLTPNSMLSDFPIIFDVMNLSPNGVLISTENQVAVGINPRDKLDIVLEPRGWFPVPVRLEGTVCRVVDEIQANSGNLVRHLGVKFTRMDDINRNAFVDLLKDILTRIKARVGQAAAPIK